MAGGGGVVTDLICKSCFILIRDVLGNYLCPCPHCILINMVKEYIIILHDIFLKFIFKMGFIL